MPNPPILVKQCGHASIFNLLVKCQLSHISGYYKEEKTPNNQNPYNLEHYTRCIYSSWPRSCHIIVVLLNRPDDWIRKKIPLNVPPNPHKKVNVNIL
jgi:hypothetical protein